MMQTFKDKMREIQMSVLNHNNLKKENYMSYVAHKQHPQASRGSVWDTLLRGGAYVLEIHPHQFHLGSPSVTVLPGEPTRNIIVGLARQKHLGEGDLHIRVVYPHTKLAREYNYVESQKKLSRI